MSIGNESRQGNVSPDALTTVALSSVADNLRLWRILSPITVVRIGYLVTVAVTVTAPVVDFDRRILPGSDTGRVDKGVGSIISPAVALQVIGAVVYKEVVADLNAGDEVSFQVTTAATAGNALPFMEYINRHEAAANQADMVAGT